VDFPSLVDRVQVPLTRFVLGSVRDPHAAEDLVQETFLRVHRNLHRYRGRAALRTWIFSIARNLCVDYHRAAGRSRLRLLDALDPGEPGRGIPESPGADPSGSAERDEQRDRVGRALKAIPPRAKEVLILRICFGLSHREIARRCRLPASGIGTRIFRARRGLLEELK
jgi:RNA polymerase sigma-70 factor (ECF subfamily)